MRPVLLAHGLLASATLMRPIRRRLRAAGHDVHLVPELSRMVTGDVRHHARELDAAVERVRRRTGAARVDVVGASQGGIVALAWATEGGWGRVGRVVALGTPFQGSPVASHVRLLGRVLPGIAQLQPGSDLLRSLQAAPLERPVTSVSMRGDPVCPPESCVLDGADHVVVEGSWGPLSHQLLMIVPEACEAIHRVLASPC